MAKKKLTIEELKEKLDTAQGNLENAQQAYDSSQAELQKASDEYSSAHKTELSLSVKLNALQTKKAQLEPVVAETAVKVKQGIDKDYGVFKSQIANIKAELKLEKDDAGKTGKLPSDYIKTSIENVANEILWWFPDFGPLNEKEAQLDEVNKVIDDTSKELSGLDVESKEAALVEAKQAAAEAKKKLTVAKSQHTKAKYAYETALEETGPEQKDAVKVNNETVGAQLDEVYAPFFNAGLNISYLSWNKLVPELKKGNQPEPGSKEELYYNLIKKHSQEIVNKAFDVLGAAGIMTVHGNEIWVDADKLKQYNGGTALTDILKAVNTVKAFSIPKLKVPKAILPDPKDFGGSNLPGNPGYTLEQPWPPEFKRKMDFEANLTESDKELIQKAFDSIKSKGSKAGMTKDFLIDEDGTVFAPLPDMTTSEVLKLLPAFQKTSSFKLDRACRGIESRCRAEGGLPKYTVTYTEFNEWLRNIKNPIGYTIAEFKKYAKQCDDDMSKCVIPIDMVVKRGINSRIPYYYDLKPGDDFVDQGVISTTISSSGAKMFEGPILLYIRIRKGSHGSFATGYSGYPNEREVILPRGSKFKVLKTKPPAGALPLTLWCELIQ